MKSEYLAVCVLVLAGAWAAVAQEKAAPADAGADLCAGRVDPYDPAAQRNLFFTAAGVDNELTVEEFNVSRKDGLAGAFDKWELMLQFDKNGNKSLDWFEMDAYRREVRKLVLEAFDQNKDGHLAGAEREAANKSLAAGKVPGLDRRDGRSGISVRDSREGGSWEERRQEMMKRYDKDGDGKLNDEERKAAFEAYRSQRDQARNGEGGASPAPPERITRYDDIKPPPGEDSKAPGREGQPSERRGGPGGMFGRRPGESDSDRQARIRQMQQRRREEAVRKFDANGDGKITGEERAALAEQARGNMEAAALNWGLRDFDADGDGRLDEKEAAAGEEYGRKIMNVGEQFGQRMMDRDGDGQISDEERREAGAQMREAGLKLMGQATRYLDADGDGTISSEERKDFQQKATTGMIRYMENFGLRYDRNRDGRLDEAERQQVLEGVRTNWAERIDKADANRDGRLSPDEMVKAMQQFGEDIGVKPVRQDE